METAENENLQNESHQTLAEELTDLSVNAEQMDEIKGGPIFQADDVTLKRGVIG